MARVRKTLDQLKQERRELDVKIKRLEQAEREAKLRGAIDAMKTLGLLDLSESELVERLKTVAPAKAKKADTEGGSES